MLNKAPPTPPRAGIKASLRNHPTPNPCMHLCLLSQSATDPNKYPTRACETLIVTHDVLKNTHGNGPLSPPFIESLLCKHRCASPPQRERARALRRGRLDERVGALNTDRWGSRSSRSFNWSASSHLSRQEQSNRQDDQSNTSGAPAGSDFHLCQIHPKPGWTYEDDPGTGQVQYTSPTDFNTFDSLLLSCRRFRNEPPVGPGGLHSQDPSMTVRADINGRYGNRLYAYEPTDMGLLLSNMEKAKKLLKSEL
ncbi:hypothetical protein OJAV_G00108800 [Oryzias javanicus]|uniref:Uncharacterized protein n=1 Tax=Oryzias javanicus TaxID=123683 RepID=A0A437CUC3_ORYJA|nr:hypothetical protein OJAV_G00108800 [Oryzias javanicus]